MKLGLWLPTFAAERTDAADVSVVGLARTAERLNFDSLWVIDHFLPTTGTVHAGSWYDPIVSLSAAAAVTERIEVGTASLVAGVRHPVALAKQIASLCAIAGQRVTLGASSGWSEIEYEAFGHRIENRGPLTDEVLGAVRGLLENETYKHRGRFIHFPDVQLVPRPTWHVPFVIGGGSRAPQSGSDHDGPTMASSVLDRIARHDGWLAPCAGSEEMTLRDLWTVNQTVGKRPFRRIHVQWTHVVDTDDQDFAHSTQIPALRAVMGTNRSTDNLLASYLTGSRTDIAERIARTRDAGFDDLVIGPVTNDPTQLELIREIVADSESLEIRQSSTQGAS